MIEYIPYLFVILIKKFYQPVREHRQKTFIMLSGFWPLREWRGAEGLKESIKKGKFVTKIYFPDNVV